MEKSTIEKIKSKFLLLSKKEIKNISGGKNQTPCPPTDGCPMN